MELFVVTGTSRGLGQALVEILIARPDTTIVEIGRAFSGKTAPNAAPIAIFVDFARPETWPGALARLRDTLGERRFSRAVLLNNAGVVAPVERFDRLGDDAGALLSAHFAVNVAAPIAFAGRFVASTDGIAAQRLVLNISSGAARRPVRGWAGYCSGKAALEMATRVMALEAADFDPNLVVASLAPGVFDTAMQAEIRELSPAAFPDVARFRDMRRDGSLRHPIDVARDIVQCIDDNRFTNGDNRDLRSL